MHTHFQHPIKPLFNYPVSIFSRLNSHKKVIKEYQLHGRKFASRLQFPASSWTFGPVWRLAKCCLERSKTWTNISCRSVLLFLWHSQHAYLRVEWARFDWFDANSRSSSKPWPLWGFSDWAQITNSWVVRNFFHLQIPYLDKKFNAFLQKRFLEL